MKKLLDLLAITVASIAHLITGVFLVNIGRIFTRMYSDTDMQLPLLSKASVTYTATAAPIMVGLGLCLATLVGLGMAFRSERTRWLLPFLLTISFVAVILHLTSILFGVTSPLVKMVDMMNMMAVRDLLFGEGR